MTVTNGGKKKTGPLYARRTNRKADKIFLSRKRTERHLELVRKRDEAAKVPTT